MTGIVDYHQTADDSGEAARRLIVRLVFVVFFLLVFEGVLRKWLFPDFERLLYFIRDPFVFIIYVIVLMNGLILLNGMLAIIGMFAVFVSGLHLLLALFGVGHPIAWGIGVRHYFFYIPLAFVIGYCFRFDDLAALIRWNLLLAIPIAVLVFLQHQSPPSALVNRSFAEELNTTTRVAGDVLRPYGTFTHASGQVLYAAASFSMLAVAWLLRREIAAPLGLLLPASAATMVIILTTGSRAIWFYLAHTALCIGGSALSAVRHGRGLRALGFVMLVGLATIALYVSVLERAYDAMLVRVEVAALSEGAGPHVRALRELTHAFEIMGQAPVAGHGLGSGVLAAVAAISGERNFTLAETEWDRIVLELGPMIGLGFIALRITLVGWLFWRALVANQVFGNPAGLVLFGFTGLYLLTGQITMSGTGSIFAWLFVGLVLAATTPWVASAGATVVHARNHASAISAQN